MKINAGCAKKEAGRSQGQHHGNGNRPADALGDTQLEGGGRDGSAGEAVKLQTAFQLLGWRRFSDKAMFFHRDGSEHNDSFKLLGFMFLID